MGAHVRKMVWTFALSAALAVCCVSAAYAADDAGAVPKDSAVKVQSGVGDGSVGSAVVQDSAANRTGTSSPEASKNPQPVRYKQGWNLIDGDWYYAVSETKLKTGWLRTGGAWYYLEPGSGKMATGLKKVGGSTYHLANSGAMTAGWALDGGKWYWSNSSGALKSGWLSSGGSWYWLDKSTFQMATGWQQVDGKWYYLDGSRGGAMRASSWILDGNGYWHWAGSGGAMKSGWDSYDGKRYYLDPQDPKHAAVTGLATVSGKQYYFDADGAMAANKWVVVDAAKGSVKLATSNGTLAGNAKKVNGKIVLCDSNGKASSGWVSLAGNQYYATPGSGAIATGWQKLGGSWYYFNNQGIMATGWARVGGAWYYLRSSGAMATGWLKDGNSWYYLDSSNGGRMVASKWQYVGSVDYKFNGSGRMVGAWVNVPAMSQYPNLPDGCESVALANMLRYYGFPTSNTTIWNSYLSFSDWNFVSAYAMGGCMAPAIRDAANWYLSARGSSLRAQDVTGSSRSDIYWYLQYGIPVQVWGTVNNGGAGYAKASQWYGGRLYNFYTGNHSIVVQGYDEERGIVYVADSISGSVTRSASSFFNNYWTTGAQAVVIR